MRFHLTVICFALIVLASCHKRASEIDFEKKVMNEILPALVDSTCKDLRIFLSPQPYPLFPPAVTELSNKEKIRRTKLWEEKRDAIRKDTASIYVAINPEIKNISQKSANYDFMIKKFVGKRYIQNNAKSYIIDIDKIKLHHRFKFKNAASIKNNGNVWTTKRDFVFSGFLYVSRILFDETKSYGILEVEYTCQERCGEGHLVLLKKVNNVWVIDKKELTWVA